MTVQITGVYLLNLCVICQYLASKVVHTSVNSKQVPALAVGIPTVQWKTSRTERALTTICSREQELLPWCPWFCTVLCQLLKQQ